VSARRLRVAVIGVGHLGSVHARILAGHARAELVALVDADPARARAQATPLRCAALGASEALPEGLDAAIVAVPTRQHAEVAVPLLERGIACLVEKPLAEDLAAADRILAAAERGRALLAVGHVERFEPGIRRLRELGFAPRFVECHRLTPFRSRGLDVGVVHDLMIHDLDLLLHLTGAEVAQVDASGAAVVSDTLDLASAHLVFANGARANVTASRVSLTPMRRFRVFAPQGYVCLDFARNHGLWVGKGPGFEREREALRRLPGGEVPADTRPLPADLLEVRELALEGLERPLQAELDSFLACVAEHRAPEVGGRDGRAALALAQRIDDAIRAQLW